MRLITLVLSLFLLSACAESPQSRDELAKQGLLSASFSSDGSHLLIGSQLHGASYWQVSPLQRKFNWNHTNGEFTQVTATAISRDAQRAATVSQNQWILWDATTGASLSFWQTPAKIQSIALNHNGTRALLGLANGHAWYLDTATGNNLKEFKHEASVNSVALLDAPEHEQSIALTGSDDYSAKLWNLKNGELLKSLPLKNMSRHVHISGSGKHAFISSLRQEHLIVDLTSLSVKSTIQERYTVFNGAQFANNDERIYLANQQGYIQVFDTADGKERNRYKSEPKRWLGATRAITTLSAQPSSLLALTVDGQLQTFETAN